MWGVAIVTPYIFVANKNKKWYTQINEFEYTKLGNREL